MKFAGILLGNRIGTLFEPIIEVKTNMKPIPKGMFRVIAREYSSGEFNKIGDYLTLRDASIKIQKLEETEKGIVNSYYIYDSNNHQAGGDIL